MKIRYVLAKIAKMGSVADFKNSLSGRQVLSSFSIELTECRDIVPQGVHGILGNILILYRSTNVTDFSTCAFTEVTEIQCHNF